MRERPEIETWLNQAYAGKDIEIELKNPPLKKAHGNDGIPGEAYKATANWAITPITKIANLIKTGQPIPKRWVGGTIVYIFKNKGDAGECKNYRLIFLTQIIYKIWSGLLTRNLPRLRTS